MSAFSRIRPTRTTLFVLIGFLWAISFGALRDFVWADLRDGLINLRGLSRPTRTLAWIGFGLLALALAALSFNDFWRATSPLLPLTQPLPGRGQMLPVALLPATLFLLSVSSALLLAGALHSHPALRIAVLLVFLPAAGLWLSNSLASTSLTGAKPVVIAGVAAALLIPIFFVLRARRTARPAIEFLIILALAALVFVPTQADDIAGWRQLGSPMMVAKIEATLGFIGALIFPLLMVVGLDIADFARQASFWTTQVVTARFPRILELAALVVLLALRLRSVLLEGRDNIAANGWQATAQSYAGGFGVLVVIALAWVLVTGLRASASPDVDETADGAASLALPLVIAVLGAQLISFVGLWLSLGVLPFTTALGGLTAALGRFGTAFSEPWGIAVDVIAVGAALWLARQRRRGPALFLAIFGLLDLWLAVTGPGRPLAALNWNTAAYVDFWLVLAIAGFALAWTVQRRLTDARIAALLFALLVTALMRQTDFISSPFSPLLGFAGLGFLVFGIAWDALTAGSWANEETPGLPRASRILLYLGYVLLTVAAVNWAVTGHDLAASNRLTGDIAVIGLMRFGRPMLYAVLIAALVNPVALHHSLAPAEDKDELSENG